MHRHPAQLEHICRYRERALKVPELQLSGGDAAGVCLVAAISHLRGCRIFVRTEKVSVPSKPAPAQAPSPSPSQAKAASSPRSAGGETAGGLPARFITRLTSGLTEAPNQRQKENGGHQKSRNKQC